MTNYLAWFYLFHLVHLYDLNDHISSSPTSTLEFIFAIDSNDSTPNPAFLLWHKTGCLILSWINAMVKCKVLPLLYYYTINSEVYALSNHFLDKSIACEMQLKLALDQLKKNDLSIDAYYQKFKELTNALDAIGQPLTKRQKV